MNSANLSTGNSQADENAHFPADAGLTKREKILQQFFHRLPVDWELMTPEHQLHHLMLVADEVLKAPGTWILVNGDLKFREAFGHVTVAKLLGDATLKSILDAP